MSITVTFSHYALSNNETLIQRVQFVYSPLNELFRSLHVLLNPRHHGTKIEWVLETQQQLSKNFWKDLHYFSLFYELGVPPFIFNNFENITSTLDQEIQLLQDFFHIGNAMLIRDKLQQILNNRNNQFIPTLAKSLEWQGFESNGHQELLNDLIEKPEAVFSHFFTFIDSYRKQIFDETWETQQIQAKLLGEIRKQATFLQKYGFVDLINHLQVDRISWHKNKLIIVKPFNQTIELKDSDTIVFLPSYFVWPHLFVDSFKHGIVLTYDASDQNHFVVSSEKISEIFNALSDPTRIKIMSILGSHASTTQALSQILMMSVSTVSHHLKILKEVKLVTTQKKGKFVLYKSTNTITNVIPNFYNMLE
ncbi:DUF5937 family protein [Enterococcus devriesei]|uniref:ArsR/SmtB family transcription factor n=1 Tax=Enterococcus devriesei TaxID=319970 RepID=UPI0036D36D2E